MGERRGQKDDQTDRQTDMVHLLTERFVCHLEFPEVHYQPCLGLAPARGQEPQDNVHHIQRPAEQVRGTQLQENVLLYSGGEGDLGEEGREGGREGRREGKERNRVEEVSTAKRTNVSQ